MDITWWVLAVKVYNGGHVCIYAIEIALVIEALLGTKRSKRRNCNILIIMIV